MATTRIAVTQLLNPSQKMESTIEFRHPMPRASFQQTYLPQQHHIAHYPTVLRPEQHNLTRPLLQSGQCSPVSCRSGGGCSISSKDRPRFPFQHGGTPEDNDGYPESRNGMSVVHIQDDMEKLACDVCGATFPCPSLRKKHVQRHTKPFKCPIVACPRVELGFTSKNDLTRHLNSVHKIADNNKPVGYDCRYDACKDKTKVYYRLDNFRNHLKKLHAPQDGSSQEEFLKRAENECRVSTLPSGASSDDGNSGSSTPECSDPDYLVERRTPDGDSEYDGPIPLDEAKTAECARLVGERWKLLQMIQNIDAQLADIERDNHIPANFRLIKSSIKRSRSPAHPVPPAEPLPMPQHFPSVCTYAKCGKELPSASYARKHLMRHQKPYTCTSTNCGRTFGSKDDWKRHENTQHHRIEFWVCKLRNQAGKTCSGQWYRKENYINHLRGKEHGIVDKAKLNQTEKLNHYPAPPSGGQYWCGFCEQLKKITAKEGWDARFDHLEKHFLEDGLRYGDHWSEPAVGVKRELEDKNWTCCACEKGHARGEECPLCSHRRCPECMPREFHDEALQGRKRSRKR